jgi:hypothetical protein
MTRLELCQEVQSILRAATGALGTTPTTTLAQTGVDGEIVRFVDRAYRDIQNEQEEWRFRTKRGSFNTVASQRVYTITVSDADFDVLLPSASHGGRRFITLYKTSEGVANEQRLWFVPYEAWQQSFVDIGSRPEAQPVRFTIEPDGQMALDPTPDAIYTIVFDYRRTLHTLTSNSDAVTGTPILPARHHEAIVWRAVQHYCISRGEGGMAFRQQVDPEVRRSMNALRFDQLHKPLFLDDYP